MLTMKRCYLLLLLITTAQARSPFLLLRGGSTRTSTRDDVQAYRLQQQLLLEARSLTLRQALLHRGLDALGSNTGKQAKLVDWDCALSTAQNRKSCLYSFDAEEGSKVIAPIDTDQWITLGALNRLRRQDPSKVEPLWHSQYAILSAWLHPNSQYSLYTHLSPTGTALSLLLDRPLLLAFAVLGSIILAFLLTFPIWESLLQTFLTSSFLWTNWPQWGRFVHAALPLKLLLGQLAWKFVADAFGRVYGQIRDYLVEWECQMWQDCIPLTILPVELQQDEDDSELSAFEEEAVAGFDSEEDEEIVEDDDEDSEEDEE
jgi:hypothetical protein